MNSNRTRPSRPSSTVRPLKNTARPAVATVTATASATPVRARRGARQLLAEAAGHQQRVVDAQAEAQQRGEVEHEDAHRRHATRRRRSPASATSTAAPPTASGTPAATSAAEHEQQREGRERQRDELAAPEVALGHGLDVAVERGAAGDADARARAPRARAASTGGIASGRVVGRQVQEHDVVGGVAVGADLARARGRGDRTRVTCGRGRHVLRSPRRRRRAMRACRRCSVSEV